MASSIHREFRPLAGDRLQKSVRSDDYEYTGLAACFNLSEGFEILPDVRCLADMDTTRSDRARHLHVTAR